MKFSILWMTHCRMSSCIDKCKSLLSVSEIVVQVIIKARDLEPGRDVTRNTWSIDRNIHIHVREKLCHEKSIEIIFGSIGKQRFHSLESVTYVGKVGLDRYRMLVTLIS